MYCNTIAENAENVISRSYGSQYSLDGLDEFIKWISFVIYLSIECEIQTSKLVHLLCKVSKPFLTIFSEVP